MHNNRVIARAVLAALCILVTTALVGAQTNTGQISGTVKDTSGGILPGVTVTVTNVNTNIARTAVTDDKGSSSHQPVSRHLCGGLPGPRRFGTERFGSPPRPPERRFQPGVGSMSGPYG
jgi:hypothetical protein